VNIATDLDFIIGGVAGDKPTGICRAYGGSLNRQREERTPPERRIKYLSQLLNILIKEQI